MKKKLKAIFLIGCLTVAFSVTATSFNSDAANQAEKEGRITPVIAYF